MKKIILIFLVLSLLLLTACSKPQFPSFIKTPGTVETTAENNETVEVVMPQQETKQCFLQNYNVLNKLCKFPSFWSDFSGFMERWVNYKILLGIIAVIILIRLFRAWRIFV